MQNSRLGLVVDMKLNVEKVRGDLSREETRRMRRHWSWKSEGRTWVAEGMAHENSQRQDRARCTPAAHKEAEKPGEVSREETQNMRLEQEPDHRLQKS
jgi:hypothetical protein